MQCGTCAIRRRKRVIFTRVSPLLPRTPGTGVGFSGAGAALAAGAAALGVAAALTGLGADAWDAVAVGAWAGATGAATAFPAGDDAAAAFGAADVSATAPVGSMLKSGSPTLTSSPCSAKVSKIRPAKGLRTSTVT